MRHNSAVTLADSGSPIVRGLHTVTASNNSVHICKEHISTWKAKKFAEVEIMNQVFCQIYLWILGLVWFCSIGSLTTFLKVGVNWDYLRSTVPSAPHTTLQNDNLMAPGHPHLEEEGQGRLRGQVTMRGVWHRDAPPIPCKASWHSAVWDPPIKVGIILVSTFG